MTHSAPRIAPAKLPLSDEQALLMGKLIPPSMPAPSLYLITARNAGLFKYMVESNMIGPTGLMDRRSLPPILRESIILRTCVANQCDYEFNLHVQTISARMGLSREQIDDIKNAHCTPSLWGGDHLAIFALVDALVVHRKVSDAVFAEAKKYFDDAALLDITNLIGMYTGVAMMAALAKPTFDLYQFPLPVLARVTQGDSDE